MEVAMTTAGRQGPGICAVRGLFSCDVRLCVIFVIAILESCLFNSVERSNDSRSTAI
jgi:hypothetical protein